MPSYKFEKFRVLSAIIIQSSKMQGLKRKRRCQDECKDHLFSLTCMKPNSAKYDIKLLFCPKYQREPQPPQFIHPEFNNDGKYYTSAFILGVDRRVLIKNEQQEIMDHQKQVRDSLEKHNQLVFPRPNSKHSHCSVCKEHYRNYYMHIATEEHRQKITASAYNLHIKGLCSIYLELWEGAEEKADEEAEKRQAEEEERRQRMAEMIVREEVEEEAGEESLLDVNRGDHDDLDEDNEDDADVEEYQAKQPKKSTNRHYNYNNDDTVPLARACKRAAPASGRLYQSEYLRKKHLMNSLLTAQRLHKEREERRYQRERDKIKTERDLHATREFIKITEKEGDVFIVMKAAYSVVTQQTQQSPQPTQAVQFTQQSPKNNQNNQNIQNAPQPQLTQQPQQQQQSEFVWKRAEKIVRKQEKQASISEKQQGSPQRIQKQNRKYQIHYDQQMQHNKDDLNDQLFDMRYSYYSYVPPPPPPYLPPTSTYKQPFKNDHSYKTEAPYKSEHGFKHQNKSIIQGRSQSKSYDQFNPPSSHPHAYSYPYPYPMYDHYPRDKNQYYPKQKQKPKIIAEKPYEYSEAPYHWSYPPPYYMPPHQQHPPKPTSGPSASSYPGNTNININFPMYMCPPPPPHPSYPVSSSRYATPPVMNPYMGYQYPPYTRQGPPHHQSPQAPTPPYSSHSYPQPPMQMTHQYQIKNPPIPHQNYPPQSSHPPSQQHQGYPPYMHHYPPPQYQYPSQYPPSQGQPSQKNLSKF